VTVAPERSHVPGSFLTLFPDFEPVHVYKDVGAIPYYLAREHGWNASVAFFEKGRHTLSALGRSPLAGRVLFVSLGRRGNRAADGLRTAAFLAANGRKYDVLNLYHDGPAALAYAWAFKRANPRGVVYMKLDMDHRQLERFLAPPRGLLARLLSRARHAVSRRCVDLYTVETASFYDRLRDHPYYRGRLHHLPNGLAREEGKDIDEILAGKERIILTVGRLGHPQKNTELFIDAVASVSPELLEGWKVILAGPVASPSLPGRIEAAVARHPHLEGAFVLAGNIADRAALLDLYRRARIFCLTSRWESFGFALLEAMHAGDYVISSDLPAPREILGHGAAGALFPPGDRDRLAELIGEALSGRVDLDAMGRKAYAFVRERFDWAAIAGTLDALLEACVARSRAQEARRGSR